MTEQEITIVFTSTKTVFSKLERFFKKVEDMDEEDIIQIASAVHKNSADLLDPAKGYGSEYWLDTDRALGEQLNPDCFLRKEKSVSASWHCFDKPSEFAGFLVAFLKKAGCKNVELDAIDEYGHRIKPKPPRRKQTLSIPKSFKSVVDTDCTMIQFATTINAEEIASRLKLKRPPTSEFDITNDNYIQGELSGFSMSLVTALTKDVIENQNYPEYENSGFSSGKEFWDWKFSSSKHYKENSQYIAPLFDENYLWGIIDWSYLNYPVHRSYPHYPKKFVNFMIYQLSEMGCPVVIALRKPKQYEKRELEIYIFNFATDK